MHCGNSENTQSHSDLRLGRVFQARILSFDSANHKGEPRNVGSMNVRMSRPRGSVEAPSNAKNDRH